MTLDTILFKGYIGDDGTAAKKHEDIADVGQHTSTADVTKIPVEEVSLSDH